MINLARTVHKGKLTGGRDGDHRRQPLSLLRHGVYIVRLWFGSLWSSVLRGQRGGDPTSQQGTGNTNSYSSHMDSPPDNDCCSVCHDSFTLPCQANCAHWFCGECFLYHSILRHVGGESVRVESVEVSLLPPKVSRGISGLSSACHPFLVITVVYNGKCKFSFLFTLVSWQDEQNITY